MQLGRVGLSVLVLSLAWPGSATAQSSHVIPLTDVLARARASPQVALIARLELKRAKLKRDDVFCTAETNDRTWIHLRGTPIGPYECNFGERMLVLAGRIEYTDIAGQKLRASDPALKEKAARLTERRFNWRWKKQSLGESSK
jgi:hypothetical protein